MVRLEALSLSVERDPIDLLATNTDSFFFQNKSQDAGTEMRQLCRSLPSFRCYHVTERITSCSLDFDVCIGNAIRELVKSLRLDSLVSISTFIVTCTHTEANRNFFRVSPSQGLLHPHL
jgi:hypothetical protein